MHSSLAYFFCTTVDGCIPISTKALAVLVCGSRNCEETSFKRQRRKCVKWCWLFRRWLFQFVCVKCLLVIWIMNWHKVVKLHFYNKFVLGVYEISMLLDVFEIFQLVRINMIFIYVQNYTIFISFTIVYSFHSLLSWNTVLCLHHLFK